MREKKHYTYADYLTWGDEYRYELIDGVPYLLAAPNRVHQRISMALSNQLYNFLKGKPCEVYAAPFDVRLNANEGDDTVVQPDIAVVCDRAKLNDKGCAGAPDMVVEILSPTTAARDLMIKLHKYFIAGVREYWAVDPESRTVGVHIFEHGKRDIFAYTESDSVPVFILEGCRINLSAVFEE